MMNHIYVPFEAECCDKQDGAQRIVIGWKMKGLWPIFCRDEVKNLEKKNEDNLVFLDAVEEGKFCRTLWRLVPLEPEFYGE